MKLVILSILAIIFTSTAQAQVRGPRYNPPGGSGSRTSTTTYHSGSGHTQTTYYGNDRTTTYYPDTNQTGPRVVGPRYNPPGSSRSIRTTRRPQVIWNTSFGYTCNIYGELMLNGRNIHTFRYSSDCSMALSDINYYGDFCDYDDLYDQTGYLEAQFNYASECRSALGWYY